MYTFTIVVHIAKVYIILLPPFILMLINTANNVQCECHSHCSCQSTLVSHNLTSMFQDRYSMAVTFLPGKIKSWDGKRECPNQYLDMEFKYIIRYHFKDGKIYGRIMNQYSIDKYLNCIHYGQDIPNMIDILSRHLENNR